MIATYRVSRTTDVAFELTVDDALIDEKALNRIKVRLLPGDGVNSLCRGILERSPDGVLRVVPRTRKVGFTKVVPELLVVGGTTPGATELIDAIHRDHVALEGAKQGIQAQRRYQDHCRDYRDRSRHYCSKRATRGFWNHNHE